MRQLRARRRARSARGRPATCVRGPDRPLGASAVPGSYVLALPAEAVFRRVARLRPVLLRLGDLRLELFRDDVFRPVVLRLEDLREALLRLGVVLRDDDLRLAAPRFFGTLPPARRASDSPIAIACLRLVTFFPERPLFSVPRLRSCIAFLTLLCAVLPYRAICCLLASAWLVPKKRADALA